MLPDWLRLPRWHAPRVVDTDLPLIDRIRSRHLTYLTTRKMLSIAESCRRLDAQRIPGRFIEAGCALGGSTILIASVKAADRPFDVHDVFGMIPPPTADDPPEVHERYATIASGASPGIGGERYYGYQPDLLDVVQANLREFGIQPESRALTLVPGLVEDTLLGDDPVAFAHVDVDWFAPVRTCLVRILPRLSVGGVIILDDYLAWGGCRSATDACLADLGDQVTLDASSGALKVTRIRAPARH